MSAALVAKDDVEGMTAGEMRRGVPAQIEEIQVETNT